MNVIRAEEFTPGPIALVVSRFNSEITESLLKGAVERLQELGFADELITVVFVPGAVEIPLVAQRLAQKNTGDHKAYQAIVALGAVIRGETGHYDYVCKQVSDGCQLVAMQQDLPVSFGVLTTDTVQQAKDRCGGKKGHKGREAVDCALEMLSVLQQIDP